MKLNNTNKIIDRTDVGYFIESVPNDIDLTNGIASICIVSRETPMGVEDAVNKNSFAVTAYGMTANEIQHNMAEIFNIEAMRSEMSGAKYIANILKEFLGNYGAPSGVFKEKRLVDSLTPGMNFADGEPYFLYWMRDSYVVIIGICEQYDEFSNSYKSNFVIASYPVFCTRDAWDIIVEDTTAFEFIPNVIINLSTKYNRINYLDYKE